MRWIPSLTWNSPINLGWLREFPGTLSHSPLVLELKRQRPDFPGWKSGPHTPTASLFNLEISYLPSPKCFGLDYYCLRWSHHVSQAGLEQNLVYRPHRPQTQRFTCLYLTAETKGVCYYTLLKCHVYGRPDPARLNGWRCLLPRKSEWVLWNPGVWTPQN